ncbi:MAG: ABC-F family ATP-binding cassette domain-containing protein [Syntrophomonas sp.]|nr:ABC-F family ATP-binding cassette domain-containing protein [Syntrophomonas sp.]
MIQIQVRHLSKSYGEVELFKNVSFDISLGEKVGIVGANGCGKSTLINILGGLIEEDAGEVKLAKSTRRLFLPQNLPTDVGVFTDPIISAEARKYLGLLNMEPNREYQIPTLSGGEKTKLALSQILALDPNLLLLDEPTNNLDFEGIVALAQILKRYPGSVLVISHDRYFLDKVVDRIIEIEEGRIEDYPGNYTFYRDTKARLFNEKMHRYEAGQKHQKRIQEAIGQAKQWADKAHRHSTRPDSSGLKMGVKEKKRAKAKKIDKKVKSDIKRLEKLITNSEKRPRPEKTVYFNINGAASQSRRMVQASNISKSFGKTQLFDNSDFFVTRGEKVALFGPNGCGKSTLIKIFQGFELVDSGEIWVSQSSKAFVLPQNFMNLPQNRVLIEYLYDIVGSTNTNDRTLLANLGITAHHLQQTIGTLSYGEQMKVKLAEPILARRDFIILDEPTNHLDLHARTRLEETLADYEGTLLIASHDVYLLQRVCNKVLAFENGLIRRFEQSFAEYLEYREL